MVLTFQNSLFQNEGLQQDTGLLKGRWAQDGSVIKNFAYTLPTAGATDYTVTSGKRLYISMIQVSNSDSEADPATLDVKDGGAGGTRKFYFYGRSGEEQMFVFDTPIYFDTSIYHTGNTSVGGGYFVLTGWEETAP